MTWLGRCDGKRTEITEKSGDDQCITDANIANVSVGYIVAKFLNAKARNRTAKQSDRKESRMVLFGLCSKDTDGQMYTTSSIFKYILL